MPKLDRLARSVPDARGISDDLAARGIRLSLDGQVYDPADPMGKMFFNILATFAEFDVDLLRMRTREGMAVARAKGRLPRPPAPALGQAAGRTVHRVPQPADHRAGLDLLGVIVQLARRLAATLSGDPPATALFRLARAVPGVALVWPCSSSSAAGSCRRVEQQSPGFLSLLMASCRPDRARPGGLALAACDLD